MKAPSDAASLEDWVKRARKLLADAGRGDIGDQKIGEILAAAVRRPGEAWPPEPIRDVIEMTRSRDRRVYINAWRQPGGVDGMLAWYRREGLGPREHGTPARGNTSPEVPSLVIKTRSLVVYGSDDAFIRPGCFENLQDYMLDLGLHRLDGRGHWLPEECPDTIIELVRNFIES
ncbi:MAG: alpha/beta hydrolase [Rhodomicrobium sp.]